jgi:hypothetical protein
MQVKLGGDQCEGFGLHLLLDAVQYKKIHGKAILIILPLHSKYKKNETVIKTCFASLEIGNGVCK